MRHTNTPPVAIEFASSAIAMLPPARRTPMIPEPTTAASNIAVPIASTAARFSSEGTRSTCQALGGCAAGFLIEDGRYGIDQERFRAWGKAIVDPGAPPFARNQTRSAQNAQVMRNSRLFEWHARREVADADLVPSLSDGSKDPRPMRICEDLKEGGLLVIAAFDELGGATIRTSHSGQHINGTHGGQTSALRMH